MSPQKKDYDPARQRLKLLSRHLRNLRIQRGFSQEYVADFLCIKAPFVSKIENGHKYPSVEILFRLSDLYGIDIKEIFEFDYLLED